MSNGSHSVEKTEFSWMKMLPTFRKAIENDIDRGLLELRQAICTNYLQSFELDLVARLLKTLDRKKISVLPVLKVAVVSSYTSEPYANAIRIALLSEGVFADIYEVAYGSYMQEILSENSFLYEYKPAIVFIAISSKVLVNLPRKPMTEKQVKVMLESEVNQWQELWSLLGSRFENQIIQQLFELPDVELLGVAEQQVLWTETGFISALNARLLKDSPGNVNWIDVNQLISRIGRNNWYDKRLYLHAKFAFSPRYLPDYAKFITTLFRTIRSKSRKALILDLDNTLWGGVIGDYGLDGIQLGPDSAVGEAYQEFCNYVKSLSDRGVILGVCSKNELEVAKEVFHNHPHMPLNVDDFAVFTCNWNDKASNLLEIATELNVDISSLVFVDDNPAECELIRQVLPAVTVVQMDVDPELYVRKLDQSHLFDSRCFSQDDLIRSESYKARIKSKSLQARATDLSAYLDSLEMQSLIRPAETKDIARLAQMEAKTNQFNLSTRRLNSNHIETLISSPKSFVFVAFLRDCFVDHGLVSYIALSKVEDHSLVISDWLMSCRVFSRTLEDKILNHIVDFALCNAFKRITVQITPTAKNKVLNKLFKGRGFYCAGSEPEGPWVLELDSNWKPCQYFISDLIDKE